MSSGILSLLYNAIIISITIIYYYDVVYESYDTQSVFADEIKLGNALFSQDQRLSRPNRHRSKHYCKYRDGQTV